MTSLFDDFSEEIDYKPLDLKMVKENVPTYTSEKLCEMIVCDRYFGCFREIAVICMEELAFRRSKGDSFDFETFIEKAHKSLPELNLQAPNLGDVLRQAIVGKIK